MRFSRIFSREVGDSLEVIKRQRRDRLRVAPRRRCEYLPRAGVVGLYVCPEFREYTSGGAWQNSSLVLLLGVIDSEDAMLTISTGVCTGRLPANQGGVAYISKCRHHLIQNGQTG